MQHEVITTIQRKTGINWLTCITVIVPSRAHRCARRSAYAALLSFGEGWHNNHHAYPSSARHGLRWYEIDFNWLGICALQLLGLARAIKRVRFNRNTSAWQLVKSRGYWTRRYKPAEVRS